jgi:predicted nucleotidyltransferase component of viral defense system
MSKILSAKITEQQETFTKAAEKLRLPAVAVEKDVWVTAVLRALFALPYAEQISFKGGTSLSKCWNVIQRFSEDVDIAINREYFGFQGETFTIREISKKLRKAACKFCRNILQNDLTKQLKQDGISPDLFSISMNITDITTVDPEKIFIEYKSVFGENSYIRNVVVLEVNGRSMKEPLETVEIQSFIDDVFADRSFAEKPFEIQVVAPERTFLEKICLLHEEFAKKEQGKIRVNRMSRHLYDITMMLNTPIAEKALNNKELYKRIIAHRRMFQAMKDFDYDTLFPDKINIIPPKIVLSKWEDDYAKMQIMIYGNSPTFSEMIDNIKQLNERINRIVW